MDIKVGDIVRRKKDKLKMVVESIVDKTGCGYFQGDISCVYYDKTSGHFRVKQFIPDELYVIKHNKKNILPKEGDIVILKSGSIKCEVIEVDGDDISCKYATGPVVCYNLRVWKNYSVFDKIKELLGI